MHFEATALVYYRVGDCGWYDGRVNRNQIGSYGLATCFFSRSFFLLLSRCYAPLYCKHDSKNHGRGGNGSLASACWRSYSQGLRFCPRAWIDERVTVQVFQYSTFCPKYELREGWRCNSGVFRTKRAQVVTDRLRFHPGVKPVSGLLSNSEFPDDQCVTLINPTSVPHHYNELNSSTFDELSRKSFDIYFQVDW